MIKIGRFNSNQLNAAQSVMTRPDTLHAVLLDREALWAPEMIGRVTSDFPPGLIAEDDLFLIVAECLANAVLHGPAEALGIYARQRHGVVLLSFFQMPAMLPRINLVLALARNRDVREYSERLPGGLGLPILLKLVHRMTVSLDLTRLQLWIRPF